MASKPKQAFTIIELLVVIVVIGILASVIIVSYSGLSSRSTVASLQSDLTNAKKQLLNFQTQSSTNSFPTAINCTNPSTTEICIRASSSNTSLSYVSAGSGNTASFSLTAQNGQGIYNINNNSANPIIFPNIVSNGLVLYLDAGYSPSYFGTGNTWYDLSGNGKNADFNGTPTFTSLSSQSYFGGFNSNNNFLEISNSYSSPTIPVGTSSRTIMVFFRSPSWLGGYQHIVHYGNPSSDQAYGLAIYNSVFTNHTWNGNSNASGITVLPSTNYCVAVRYSSSQSPFNNFFVNGQFPSTGFGQGKTLDYAINTVGTNTLKIGMRISSPQEGLSPDGRVFLVMIYNRVLTDNELTQNYNIFRDRYGL